MAPALRRCVSMRSRFVLGLLLSASVIACGDDASDSNGGASPELDANGQPLVTRLDGTYELSSQIDLTTTGLLPDVANDSLKALSSFREKPSQTILDLASTAKVPVVSNVVDIVPGPLKDLVLGYVDDHLFKALYDNAPVTEKITGLADDLASVATKFELVTTLDVPAGDDIGNAKATHSVKGIAWTFEKNRHVVDAPELVAKISTVPNVETNAVALEKRSPKLETGRLTVGDHAFKLPIGQFAIKGADLLAKDAFGASDLRGALGKLVDCKKLADDVASRCVGVGPAKVCVGHESDIEKLCTTGLDLVVKSVQDGLSKLDIPLLSFDEGNAKMWDAPTDGGAVDGIIDRIDDGFWIAQVKGGSKTAYPFHGLRVTDATPTK
jgi:hypothetical protein